MNTLDRYSVVWKTPGKDHNDSMPIGNGDIGLNVWFERNGDLLFYIGKTDTWSENARLLKLGRIRVTLTPNPLAEDTSFRQTLRLQHGEILIKAGKGPKAVTLRIWVDANRPIIRIEADSPSPFDMRATLEVWRTHRRELTGNELHSASGLGKAPFPICVEPDTILSNRKNDVVWYHRNDRSIWADNLRHQGMEKFIAVSTDPLLHRTFGACIRGTGLKSENSTTLKSARLQKQYILSIYPLCAQTETSEDWLKQLDQIVSDDSDDNIEATRIEHRAWWNDFWNRSWIRISGFDDAETVTRAYILQRWISACAGRGAYPIKFNGSLFTVDGVEGDDSFDADYRRWGGCYWWQNTRLPYWPMLASGDYDMMKPLFKMYRDALPLARERTWIYYGHSGAFYPETQYFWGMYNNCNYGWDRTGLKDGYTTNNYIRYYWQGGLELSLMMLDFYAYTQDDTFVRETLTPLASEILTFFDQHWPRNDDGKIRFDPAMALETYNKAVNPLVEIVAIRKVIEDMLDLPETLTTSLQRSSWTRLMGELPVVPTRIVDGKKILAPAEPYDGKQNSENPELYAIFPYRTYGLGKPGLELARLTFAHRANKGDICWRQDGTQAALLGLTKIAADDVISRAKNKHEGSRFPAFWGPNFDWIPDQDHGGNLIMTLQTMLMQAEGDKILLFPAWPKNWNVDFKLHAQHNTIVEGSLQDGKPEYLRVTPNCRRNDVESNHEMLTETIGSCTS